MSTAELRAAAERLRTGAYGECNEDMFQHADDCKLLARAYLAEHPADDDQPVSNEWLDSIGFRYDEAMGMQDIQVAKDAGGGDEVELLGVAISDDKYRQVFVIEDDYRGQICVCHHPTRGDVRRLCSALGIATKEQP